MRRRGRAGEDAEGSNERFRRPGRCLDVVPVVMDISLDSSNDGHEPCYAIQLITSYLNYNLSLSRIWTISIFS